MATRRKLSTLDKLQIVVKQARCPICGERLGALDGLEWDHEQALARGGPDDISNIRAVHRQPCHAVKTRGAGATTRGSDVGEAAKTKRLERIRSAREAEQEEARRRMLARDPADKPADRRGKTRWPKRPFPARAK